MNPINNREELALDVINQIQFAIKSTVVYPKDHPITSEIISKSYESLENILNNQKRLDVSVNGGKLWVDDFSIKSKNNLSANFALDLDQRAIRSISFYRGLSRKDYVVFIKAMKLKPPSLRKNGGINSILKNHGVSTIRLNGIKYKKVLGDLKKEKHPHIIKELEIDGDLHADADSHRQNDFNVDEENISTHADRKLSESEKHDTASQTGETVNTETQIKEKKINALPQEDPVSGVGENLRDAINNLMSEGKSDGIRTVIEDLSERMNDKSWEIRKKVAESLQDITSTLDEFDLLNQHFKKITDSLIKRVEQESHVDTYLAVTKNLHKICSLQSQLDCYLIDETIGGRLFEADKLSKAQLQEALKARKKNGNGLQYNLGALDLIDEAVLTHFLAQRYQNYRVVILSAIKGINENILKIIPQKYVERYQILPFDLNDGNLYTATMNPDDWQTFKDVQFICGYPVVPHLAAEYYLLNSIEKFYNIKANTPINHPSTSDIQLEDWRNDLEFVEEKEETVTHAEELTDSDVPIIQLANTIIKEAINKKASDIHIEPYENELRVRFRIDGSLTTALNPSASYTNGLASRIKIMSGLDISERRLPQDGRFKARMDRKDVVFRVSTFPGIFGEKIVLRLLDDSNLVLDIDKLGLNKNDLNNLLSAMYKSKGMILITGPTGSGKTTTIYSMLCGLNDGSLNIATAEDPVEYNLKGINQFQMRPKIGLNFARALKTFLRQDPDIIMVGEIRDIETAGIAFKAALTGHLVLSTLHTNNAPETITRLLNIGVEPYMIISSINLIVAQRLLRKICEKCKTTATPTDLQANVLRNYGFNMNGHHFVQGEGCEECSDTGYKGRMAVYELLPMWDEVQELILKGKSTFEIRTKAEKLGLISLQAQGFNKVTQGITSLNEWMRVLA